MPKEYKDCVKSEKKTHSEKDAKKICAISYYKRHGVSVNEAHKHAKKALGEPTMKMIKLARSKEALLLEAKRISKSTGLSIDDFVVLPITNEVRNHPKMKSLEPDITEPVYRFMLVKKSVGGKDFVILQTDGKVRLDFGSLPENALANEMNQPIRQNVPGEGEVNVNAGDSADATTKSMANDEKKEECEGDDCKDGKDSEKAEKSVLDVNREEPVADEGVVDVDGENPDEAIVNKALPLLEKMVAGNSLEDDELTTVKSFIEALKVAKSILLKDLAQKSVTTTENEPKGFDGLTLLHEAVAKSISGTATTEIERRAFSAALAAAKQELGSYSSRETLKTLQDAVNKAITGANLDTIEERVVTAAAEAAKQAKSDVAKSVMSMTSHISDIEETPDALYKSMMGSDPISGLYVFVRKSESNRFIDIIKTKSLISDTPYTRGITAAERRKYNIPSRYRFVVVW